MGPTTDWSIQLYTTIKWTNRSTQFSRKKNNFPHIYDDFIYLM